MPGKLALDTPCRLHVPTMLQAIHGRCRHRTARSEPHIGSAQLALGRSSAKTYFPPGGRFSYSGEGFLSGSSTSLKLSPAKSLNTTLRSVDFRAARDASVDYIWQFGARSDYADPHDAEMAPGAKTKPSCRMLPHPCRPQVMTSACFLEAVLSGAG